MSEIICDLVVTVSENNINIRDSYTVTEREKMREVLYAIQHLHPECNSFKRTYEQMISEGRTHNRFYHGGLFKSHTRDVDINYPVKGYIQLFYNIFGM